DDPLAQRGDVGLEAGPAIVEGGRARPLERARARVAATLGAMMDPLGEKRRIEVAQLDAHAVAGQRLERREVVALDQAHGCSGPRLDHLEAGRTRAGCRLRHPTDGSRPRAWR